MKTFFDHVGKDGSRAHFPLTITAKVNIAKIESLDFEILAAKQSLIRQLQHNFPSGEFNCWGVPRGAEKIVKNMQVGDLILLVETTGSVGSVPVMGIIKVFEKNEVPELSQLLWGDGKYPYVFFFEAEFISLNWLDFLDTIGYSKAFDPRGTFCPVREDRLGSFGGTPGFLEFLRSKYLVVKKVQPSLTLYEISKVWPTSEPTLREVQDVNDYASHILMPETPELTSNDSEITQVERKKRDSAFHAIVGKVYGWKCAVCGLSLQTRDSRTEIEAAHIFPKSMKGSDDPRNGISLCRTHHWAFDNGLFALVDDLRIIIPDWLPTTPDYTIIRGFSGKQISIPTPSKYAPHRIFLREHRKLHGFLV